MADTAALDRANKLLDDQQPAKAVELLTRLVEREPENAEAHNLLDVLRLDKTKKGEITKAAQRQIQKLDLLIKSDHADDQAADYEDDAPSEEVDPSIAADAVDEVICARVTSIPTLPSAAVPLERLLEELIEEKILRGHEVFGRRLMMHEAPDGLYGRQFPAGDAGRIDLLAVDVESGSFVVIELKRGDDFAGVVQQTARYVVWVKRNLARRRQEVHGVVCLDRSCAALESAAKEVGIDVYEYDLRLTRKT